MEQILMVKDEAFKVLKNTKTFQYLSGEDLDNLYRFCKFVKFEKGEKIIGENEINPNLYVIAKGSVNVMIHEEDKKDVFLSSIGEGDIFGEAALFINMKRTADVYAIEHTELIEIERDGLFSYFKLFPAAGVKVLMVITYSLLLKLHESHLQLAFDRKSYINQEEVDNLMKVVTGS
jgi:CRP-like cAMP-binding protein